MYSSSYYSSMFVIIFLFVFAVAIQGLLAWGSGRLAQKKGYDFAPYCVLGFFLGVIGLIIAAVIPEKTEGQSKNVASSAEALGTYKKLLDEGAITQEEYDKKKSELLQV